MTNDTRKLPAAEQAYRSIRSSIVSGALKEGERLTEKRLSKDLGLSRTPVREAISRLILEGFVERQSGYTTRVATFPEDEIEQIFELRRMLEAYSARRAAMYATVEDIAQLRAMCAVMRAHTPPVSDNDFDVLTKANEDLHGIIVRAARAPRLTALLSMAFEVGMVVRTYRIYSAADLERSLRHHEEICDAIEARAPDWAEALMSAHLLAGARRVLRTVRARTAPDDSLEAAE